MTANDKTPSDLWLAALLLGHQSILYLLYPHMTASAQWHFFVMAFPTGGLVALILWECRSWVRRPTMHVVNGLILADTLVEAVLQSRHPESPKRVVENFYCVAAFAAVYVIWRVVDYAIGTGSEDEPV